MSASQRFSGFRFQQGLVVLDQHTGEVVLVPVDGSEPKVLRAGSSLVAVSASQQLEMAAPSSRGSALVQSPTDPTALDSFDTEIVEKFPYPIAVCYAKYILESDPRQRCRLLVDVLALLLKCWALQLAAEYMASTLRDPQLNEFLGRDLQRPLLSTWNLFTARAVAVFRSSGVTFFSPELADAFDRLEAQCRDPVLIRTRYEDANGKERFRESRLAKIQALIKFRNGLAHGYNVPREKAQADLGLYAPVLRDVLWAARFMIRYPWVVRVGEAVVSLMGATPDALDWLNDGGHDGAIDVCVQNEAKQLLQLPPLVELDRVRSLEPDEASKNELFLFEGNTKSTLIFASPVGEHLEKASGLGAWRTKVESKRVEAQTSAARDVVLPALVAAARRVSEAQIDTLVQTGKFIRDVSVSSRALVERFAQFDLGDYRGLVLLGESGSGKTTALAIYAEERIATGDVVLFYRASSLLDVDLQARVVRDLSIRDIYFEDLLAVLDERCFRGSAARLWIIIDGANEHPSDVEGLIRSIDAMVRQAESYPFCRVMVGVRRAAYERLAPESRFARLGGRFLRSEERRGEQVIALPYVVVPPMDKDSVAQLYERYRNYSVRADESAPTVRFQFRPNTSFEELESSGTTVAMLRNPLMMRLLLAAFNRRDLPSMLSFDEAMRLYFDHVIMGMGEPGEERPARGAFLLSLVRVLDEVGSDSISRDRLYEVPALKRDIQNTQKDSLYAQLLDLGVLGEMWDRDTCLVRFSFDKLFEYLLAEMHVGAIANADAVLSLVSRAVSFHGLRGALQVALVRACQRGNWAVFSQAVDRSEELAEREFTVLGAIARAVIGHLARSHDPNFAPTLDSLTGTATKADVHILEDIFDRLFAVGEAEAATLVAESLLKTAQVLAIPDALAGALFRRGMILQQRGDLSEALQSFEKARELTLSANGFVLAHRIDVIRSEILRLRGDTDGALRLMASASSALLEDGMLADAAEARRQQAILMYARGARLEGQQLFSQALDLARKSGDLRAETACLISCGVTAWKQGDIRSAEKWFEQASILAESAGNLRSLSHIEGNLGLLCRERGAFSQAIPFLQKQLLLARKMDHLHSIAIATMNLGVLYFESGKIEEVETRFLEAANLFERTGDHSALAMTHTNLAALYLYWGDVKRAKQSSALALKIASEPLDADAQADALWVLLSVAFEEGAIAEAAKLEKQFVQVLGDSVEPRRLAQKLGLQLWFLMKDTKAHESLEHNELFDYYLKIRDQVAAAPTRIDAPELPVKAVTLLAQYLARQGLHGDTKVIAKEALLWLANRPSDCAQVLQQLSSTEIVDA